MSKEKILVTRDNIKDGLKVIDKEDNIGEIITCEDLHNVDVIFKNGGAGFYCFAVGCGENSEIEDPLYYFDYNSIMYLTNIKLQE